MDQEDGAGGLAHHAEGSLAMGLEDRIVGDLLAVGQAVEGIERGRIVDLLGQGASWVLDDGIGDLDQPSGASDVAQLGLTEVKSAERSDSVSEASHRWAPPKVSLVRSLRRP